MQKTKIHVQTSELESKNRKNTKIFLLTRRAVLLFMYLYILGKPINCIINIPYFHVLNTVLEILQIFFCNSFDYHTY